MTRHNILDVAQRLVLLLVLVLAFVEVLHGCRKLQLGLRLLIFERSDRFLGRLLLLLQLSDRGLEVGALLQEHLVLTARGADARRLVLLVDYELLVGLPEWIGGTRRVTQTSRVQLRCLLAVIQLVVRMTDGRGDI